MTIAELFIKIGMKGGDQVSKGLTNLNKGLGSIVETSLEAKAAMLAVVAGLERMTGFASQVGMDLYKFGVTTGLSTQELQKWQYAAMRFDVTGEEMANTVKSVQQAMSDMLLGKGSPEALGLLAEKVGFDPKRARDTFYVMGKLQEFAKKVPPDIANNLLKSFGISDNVFQFLKSSNMELDKLDKKKIITNREIERLVEINKAWKDFWFTLKTMSIKFVASEGFGAFMKEMSDGFQTAMDVIQWLGELIDQSTGAKVAITGLGVAFALLFSPLTALATILTAIIAMFAELKKLAEGKEMFGGLVSAEQVNKFKSFVGKPGAAIYDWLHPEESPAGTPPAMVPAMAGAAAAGGGSTQVSNTQSNVFHISGAQSPAETGEAVRRAVSDAARQMSAQAEGSRRGR